MGGEKVEEEINNFEKEFMYYVIDRVIDFPLILKKAGYEDYDYGTVYCPFHNNTDSPAGKLYQDDEGDRLYCFANKRMFRPSDVLKRDMIKIRLQKVFYRIWKKLSGEKKSRLREEYGQPQEDFLSDEFKEVVEKMEKFKNNKINFDKYLELVMEGMEVIENE